MKKINLKITIFLLLTGVVLVTATEFAVNTHRNNPYPRYKFQVKWDGRIVPGIIRVSGLNRVTQITTFKSGASPKGKEVQIPGKTSFDPIVLERGRTHDVSFERWAEKIWNRNSDSTNNDYKKDITVQLLNEAGQVAMTFNLYDCWPVKYSALTGLDSESSEMAIEQLVLQYTGWERDKDVSEPSEPGFTVPQ